MDGNGDGAEVEAKHLLRDQQGNWVGGGSSGVGGFDDRPIWTWWWKEGTGFVIGRVAPGQAVTVEWFGEGADAVANDLGVYVALFPGQPEPRRPDLQNLRPARMPPVSGISRRKRRPTWSALRG